MTIKRPESGANKKKFIYEPCTNIKSTKFPDEEWNTNITYITVIKISIETIWTAARTTPIIEYLDWLNKPIIIKKILLNITKIKWKKIIPSKFLKSPPPGKKIKFCKKITWIVNKSTIKGGQSAVKLLGRLKDSFDANFKRSTTTCSQPLRPAKAGPNLLCAKASNFLSVRTTKSVKIIKNIIKIKPKSQIKIHN